MIGSHGGFGTPMPKRAEIRSIDPQKGLYIFSYIHSIWYSQPDGLTSGIKSRGQYTL